MHIKGKKVFCAGQILFDPVQINTRALFKLFAAEKQAARKFILSLRHAAGRSRSRVARVD